MSITINNFYNLFIIENNNDKLYYIFIIFINLFDLISILIYNEFIQLNCFDFDRNTKKNIMIRAENEFEICDLSLNSEIK